jgi:hypothetical protein
MPYDIDPEQDCKACPYGGCIEDRRNNPVRGRKTKFRLKQQTAILCTFSDFIPGSDEDPDPERTYECYLEQFRSNARTAGNYLYREAFSLTSSALAKVEGDVFELLEAAAFWNAAAAWNNYMNSGQWDSRAFVLPLPSVPTPTRKVAIVKLPRGYNSLNLFRPDIKATIEAFENSLRLRGMELGLSAPDIVGVRLPHPLPDSMDIFLNPLSRINNAAMELLERSYLRLEGHVESTGFLFAIAVKKTTRSDRLYQPLFEANILRYLIENVLKGAAFKFYAHLNSTDGADVAGHYKAASLISLIRGGNPSKAIDELYIAQNPRDSAQSILNDLPLFLL